MLRTSLIRTAAALGAAFMLSTAPALAGGDITVTGAFAKASLPAAKAGASFMTIENNGDTPDRLTGVRAGISDMTQLHENTVDANGVAKMRHIKKGVVVPAHGEVAFAPGGKHVMYMGLKAPLTKGEAFPLTLIFEHAGEIPIEVKVIGAKDAMPAAD